jgi:hypothetical protein
MNKLLGATLLAGMLASAYGQADVRQAVRWEQAKERAAAKQAAIERGDGAEAKDAEVTPAPASGVEAAIRYEQFKEAAAARQARIAARAGKTHNSITASGRR